MKKNMCNLQITDNEKRILIQALLQLKENQIKQDKSYDFLDDLIVKVCDARSKNDSFLKWLNQN